MNKYLAEYLSMHFVMPSNSKQWEQKNFVIKLFIITRKRKYTHAHKTFDRHQLSSQ